MRKNFIYPSSWKHGPDANKQAMNKQFLMHRGWAYRRGEPYTLTFDDWWDIFSPPHDPERFKRYGNKSGQVSLYRIDKAEPWSRYNVIALTPEENGLWQRFQTASKKYHSLQSEWAAVRQQSSLQER